MWHQFVLLPTNKTRNKMFFVRGRSMVHCNHHVIFFWWTHRNLHCFVDAVLLYWASTFSPLNKLGWRGGERQGKWYFITEGWIDQSPSHIDGTILPQIWDPTIQPTNNPSLSFGYDNIVPTCSLIYTPFLAFLIRPLLLLFPVLWCDLHGRHSLFSRVRTTLWGDSGRGNKRIQAHTCMYTYMCICVYLCLYIFIWIYIYIHLYTYEYSSHLYMYVCIYECICICHFM